MANLNPTDVYNLLNYDWWVDAYPYGTTGPIYPTSMIYFMMPAGIYGMYYSTGPVILTDNQTEDASTREYYVMNVLMQDTARYLSQSGCTGNITNIRPSAFQSPPIYFK